MAVGAYAQDARVFYTVTQNGPPTFQYEFSFLNNLDPALFPGFDLYDISISLDGMTDVAVTARPLGWTEAVIPESVEFFSFLEGEPPAGTDIAPGATLGGFQVQSSQSLGGSLFTAQFVNPNDPTTPVTFEGIIEATVSAAAPEPASVALASLGLIGLAIMRRKVKVCHKLCGRICG